MSCNQKENRILQFIIFQAVAGLIKFNKYSANPSNLNYNNEILETLTTYILSGSGKIGCKAIGLFQTPNNSYLTLVFRIIKN